MILQLLGTILALVLIFIFAINKFSHQIERVAGERFKTVIRRITRNRYMGIITGTAVTSIIQSSTATTVMTVGLVNAGMLTFHESLGVILGANIGTTITSQLIALNLTAVAPFIIILGFLILQFGGTYKHYGKSVFYFGLVFFCISLMSQVVTPLSENETMLKVLSHTNSLPIGILVGILFTLILQSSTVTMGLTIVLASTGVLNLEQSIGIMLGSNIGTVSTALLAVIPMGIEAKKAAVAHLVFNVVGCVAILPLISFFTNLTEMFSTNLSQHIANMHLVFNIFATVVFLIFFKQFVLLIEWMSKLKLFNIDPKKWEPKV